MFRYSIVLLFFSVLNGSDPEILLKKVSEGCYDIALATDFDQGRFAYYNTEDNKEIVRSQRKYCHWQLEYLEKNEKDQLVFRAYMCHNNPREGTSVRCWIECKEFSLQSVVNGISDNIYRNQSTKGPLGKAYTKGLRRLRSAFKGTGKIVIV